jgi:hypothetical protein
VREKSRLRELVEKGAKALRCSAALGRPVTSIRKMARQLGLSMAGIREVNAGNRLKIENAENDLAAWVPTERRKLGLVSFRSGTSFKFSRFS